MNKKRIVVTGMGTINPIGETVSEFWQNALEGKSGIEIIKAFDTEGLRVRIAGEVRDFDPLDYFDKKKAKRMDRVCQLGLAATQEAIEQSQLADHNLDPARIGVVTGSGIGGIQTLENQHERLLKKKARYVSPLFIPMMIPDMIPGRISMEWNFTGPNYSITSACATSIHSIGVAYNHIMLGDADIMITGGAEASITPLALAGFTNMKALSKRNDEPHKASRPFDKDRDGFVMSEGAGIVVLEELEHARQRNAPIFAEVIGYGFSSDAHHITAPHPEGKGAAQAMQKAIDSSGLEMEDFKYINAHGTSTPANDPVETKAIKSVFGELAKQLHISSTKSMTGHILGATGGVEFIALCKSLQNQIIPPTTNHDNPDPECDLNYTPNKPRELEFEAGLSNGFGFGGHNATIAVKRYKE
ncbi:MAG: beta-ketoacyl-ACP synthase II [Candidatus Marinimicrobia bacterium]|nr:beta-ketoacyl-ACP synthase II [Candidatus Neomarinimicrobiota bacterium]